MRTSTPTDRPDGHRSHPGLGLLLLLIGQLLLTSLLQAAEDSDTEATDQTSHDSQIAETDQDRPTGPVVYLHIDDVIDPLQARYVERALAEAEERGARALITRISSFGGRVDSAYEISQQLLEAQENGMRTVAYIDGEAISAGALIAYSHQEVYLTDTSTIGNIGVVIQTAEGMEFASEKMVTFVRNYLKVIAQKNDWNETIIRKMTALEHKVYEVRPDPEDPDERIFLLGNELDAWLADHPDIDRDDGQRVFVRWPEGELITLTAADALAYDMATAVVPDIEAVYGHLQTSADSVQQITKTATELIADTLGGWAPLLAGLTMLLVVFEMKTPGVGIFAILAATSGVLFLICQFYLDLAGNLEVLLLLAGLALVLIELFTMATGGLLAAVGGLSGLIGLLLAFMPEDGQFTFDENWGGLLAEALKDASLALVIGTAGMILGIIYLPRSPAMRRIAVLGTSGDRDEPDLIDQASNGPVGRSGRCLSALHPGGQVELDGRIWSARSWDSSHLPAGTAVRVQKVSFGELIVEPADPAADPQAEGQA